MINLIKELSEKGIKFEEDINLEDKIVPHLEIVLDIKKNPCLEDLGDILKKIYIENGLKINECGNTNFLALNHGVFYSVVYSIIEDRYKITQEIIK